jgi:hypothetical protein
LDIGDWLLKGKKAFCNDKTTCRKKVDKKATKKVLQ